MKYDKSFRCVNVYEEADGTFRLGDTWTSDSMYGVEDEARYRADNSANGTATGDDNKPLPPATLVKTIVVETRTPRALVKVRTL